MRNSFIKGRKKKRKKGRKKERKEMKTKAFCTLM